MTYDWENYQQFANSINSGINKETDVRNIVSRLFYHSFHCMENWAELKKGYNPTECGTHNNFKKWLKVNNHRRAHDLYSQFLDIRCICDYDSEMEGSLDNIVSRAKELDSKVTGLFGRYSKRNCEKPMN